MPENIVKSSGSFEVPDAGVRFFADLEKQTKNGGFENAQIIESRYREILKKATRLILIGETYIPETASSSIQRLVTEKHVSDKHTAIALLIDPLSSRYGGIQSPTLESLRTAGIFIVEANMITMPDSNLFYSSFWRPFFSWWGNSYLGGRLADPIGKSDSKFTLRSWLAFLNMKMNESHILLADNTSGHETKLISLFSSTDLSSPRGSTGAVALEVDDSIWRELYQKQNAIAGISGAGLPSYGTAEITDATGQLHASLINIKELNKKIISLVDQMGNNDQLDISLRYLSDRDIISALKDAANRNVHIRIVLDPNLEAYGHQLYGMPNRPAAKELVSQTSNGVIVRWCDPQLLPCESRLMLGKTASSTFLMTGGADFTRRDTGGYNLESEILIESSHEFTASKAAEKYFNSIWTNDGGAYTVDYLKFADDTLWRSSVYRMMERTGISMY